MPAALGSRIEMGPEKGFGKFFADKTEDSQTAFLSDLNKIREES